MSNIGVVVIGRNEGDRLIRCLKSIIQQLPRDMPVIYVDSGSTDESVPSAQAMGVHVVELDLSVPFTMARGRNTGFNYLTTHFPNIQYVQFVDGDCELVEGWIKQALAKIETDSRIAIVCGRRRERFPDASPYNRLADMEWNTPVGEAMACGGDALARVEAIQSVEGYNQSLICGEEPEMCIRLRQKGWKIWRIDVDMTLHDAAMLKFSQWWRRSIRGGWAVAEGTVMYGSTSERYMVQQSKSGWLWGLVIPAFALAGVWVTVGLSLALLLIGYSALALRIYRWRRQHYGDQPSDARLYALFCVLSKPAQALGQVRYWLARWQGKQATLIEYKSV
jgi:glycosyltransferase involved in cell wall biosynthesis